MSVRVLVIVLACSMAAAAAPAEPPAPDRAAIDELFRSIERALLAREVGGVLAAYDASAGELAARTRAATQGWLALTGARVSYRIGALTGHGDSAVAVVLRRVTFTDHGRAQVEARWETVGLHRLVSGWRIVAEDERDHARTASAELAVELQPDAGTLRGSSRLEVEITEAGEDSLLLTLNRGLGVTSLTDASGRELHFDREADVIEVADHALRPGDRRTLTVAFTGTLFNESREQGYSQVSIAPEGSFASWVTGWYPHLLGVGSKAKGRISYDVPVGITVASSGRLASRKTQAGRTREVFAVDRPLDFSFAAAPYFHREATVDGVHLGVYLLSGGEAKASLYMREAARVLRIERRLHGGYPFDGYAVVEIPSTVTGGLGGSSEQGMNLFPVGLLPDAEFPLLLVAHEIGHSWWGNLVGSADGAILGEGLAQMAAVICLRELRGDAVTRNFLEWGVPGYPQSAAQYFARFAGTTQDAPLGTSPSGAEASAVLHDLADTKGMLVLDMLREAIGPDAFAAGLRTVVRARAGKSATLADLRAAWEAASGKRLGTFFAQWFARTGAPELALVSSIAPAGAGFAVSGEVAQLGDRYDLEVELALGFAGRRELRKLAVTGATTQFSFSTATRPEWIVLDPDYRVLRWTPEFRNQALLASGRSLQSLGRLTEACARLDDYVAKAPDSLEGHYRAGACAEQADHLDAAEREFQVVIDRHRSLGRYAPAVTLAQLHLGYLLDRAGRRDAARTAYREVLRLPDESEAHHAARAGLAAPQVAKAPATPPDHAALARFVGDYDTGSGVSARVAFDDLGILVVALRGRPAEPLIWVDGAHFRLSSLAVEFVGTPDVSGLDLYVDGHLVFHLPRLSR